MLKTKNRRELFFLLGLCCIDLYNRLIIFSFFLNKIKSHAKAIRANGIFFDEANTKEICTQWHNLWRPASFPWAGWGGLRKTSARLTFSFDI